MQTLLKRFSSQVIKRTVKTRKFKVVAPIMVLLVILASIFITDGGVSSANARGDGIMLYGVSGNTNPQAKGYASLSNTLLSTTNTVAGAVPQNVIVRASSTKQEMVGGYIDASGNLQVMCYDGTTWSNEWSVAVGGTGTTSRFDIAYETNSGKVMVLYSTNATTTNELAYRTKLGSAGCGSANWAAAANLDPVRTSGAIAYVKLAADSRGSSNLIAAMWADTGSSASTMTWSGSAWGNEPTTALATTGALLERVGASQDVQSFDLSYESQSGDLMVAWGISGASATNLIKYRTCTGGVTACTWSATANVPTVADAATNLDIAADPSSDQIALAAIDNSSCDLSAAYWNGTSAWTGQANVDTNAECPATGEQLLATTWVTNAGNTRRVVAYDSGAAGTTTLSYRYASVSANLGSVNNFAASPVLNQFQATYNFQNDPFNADKAMLTVVDTGNQLFAKRLALDGSGVPQWSNTENGSAITSSIASQGAASFAYWRATSAYTQSAYRWYSNTSLNGAGEPTSALANQNTAATTASNSAILRLRMGLTVSTANMEAGTQDFKLQYGTSTSGPWTDIGNPPDTWCNATTGITCNTSWTNRIKITINNSASASNLTNYPLLVKLNSSRIDYTKTQNSGQDIRFVDPSDSSTVLSEQVEQWNESGDSYVWVKVPQIDAASSSDYIWLYYGNASASDGQDAANVWDSNFKGVYHSSESSGSTIFDSTGNANNGTKNASSPPTPSTGQIAGGQTYAANGNSNVSIPDSSSLDLTTFTISAWVLANGSLTNNDGWKTIFCKDNPTNYCMQTNPSSQLEVNYSIGGSWVDAAASTTVAQNTWYFVTGTYDGATLRLYVNGASSAAIATTTTPPTNNSALVLGRSVSSVEYWPGNIDEARVSIGARSADWVKADYLSQSDTMLTYGNQEDQTSDSDAGVWQFYDNTSITNGRTLTSTLLAGTTALESYQEKNPTIYNPTLANVGSQAEWDFALNPSGVCGGTYYFRMVKSDGTALTTYTNYPSLTIDLPAHVPTDKALRHGAWFNNGVKQPYGCDWVSN